MRDLLQSHPVRFGALILLILIVALPILTYPIGRDQGMYANIGRSILNGGVPFIDMWDIKPPPIYYLYALTLGLFGTNAPAIRALDLFWVPLGMFGMYVLGRQIKGERLGLFSALIYGAFYFNDGFQNLSQSDSLATIPTIWLAYVSYRASQDERTGTGRWWALIAGLIAGVLLWFKPQQYALIVGAVVIYHLLQQVSTARIRLLFAEVVAFALGGALTGGTLLLYFASQGIVQEILIVAEGTASYNAQGYDWSSFVANMRQGFYYRWLVWHALIVLSVIWALVKLVRHGVQRIALADHTRLLILWLTGALCFAFVQAKGFDTHWLPLLPPLALMSALVLDQLCERVPSGRKLLIALYALIVIGLMAIPTFTIWGKALPYVRGQQTLAQYWDGFQANDLKPEESLAVAEFLRERVTVGDSLYIWGFRPEVYVLAKLWPATRYQAHFPLVAPWYPLEWQQQNVDLLWASMPPYVLVLEDDYMPWVTDSDADSHTLLQDYTELNNWLIANYERDEHLGDFIIWRRAIP
ncbi:MAG: ArnT family glycosyltransferase [Anaerolineae bacterium]